MRYAIVNFLYRLRFRSGSIGATDFRPHFEGHLLNACMLIPAGLDAPAVEAALSRRLRHSFEWMRLLRFLLRRGDLVQYCLGTAEPRRQYLKAWSSRDDLASGIPPRDVAENWRARGAPPPADNQPIQRAGVGATFEAPDKTPRPA